MTKLASYYLPGLYVEDHSIDVPLDWRGLEPMMLALGDSLRRGARPAPICGAPRASSCSTASCARRRTSRASYPCSCTCRAVPAASHRG